MTNLELITGSLQDLGEVGQGETPSAEDGAFGLDRLNELLNSLSNDRQNIAALSTFTGNLSANVGTYTFGPGGGLAVTIQPVLIQGASVVLGGINLAMEIIAAPAWNAIQEPALTGTLPLRMWPNRDMVPMTLNVWPRPSGAPGIVINYWGVIGGGATLLSDTLVVPPGYLRAIRTILAIEMAPGYGRQPSEALAAAMKDSYAILRNRNLLDTFNSLMPVSAPARGEPQLAQGAPPQA